MPEEVRRSSQSVWDIIRKACELQVKNDTELCSRYRAFSRNVFNATILTGDKLNLQLMKHVYPSIFSASGILNLSLMLVVILKMEKNSYFVFLGMQSFCDVAVSTFQLPMIVYFFILENYKKTLPPHLCRLFLVSMELIPPLMLGISSYLTIGMLVQRYVIVKYPLRAKAAINNKCFIYGFISIAVVVNMLVFIPYMLNLNSYLVYKLASNQDNFEGKETLLLATEDGKEQQNRIIVWLILRIVFQKGIPVTIAMIWGVKFHKQLILKRQAQLQMTNMTKPTTDTFGYLSDLTKRMIIMFLVIEIPTTLSLIVTTYLVYDGTFAATETQDINVYNTMIYVGNILSILSLMSNTCICYFSGTAFRVALKEILGKAFKCK